MAAPNPKRHHIYKGHVNDVTGDGFIQLTPRTHDTAFSDCHIADIKQFGKDINDAVQAVWPRRHEYSSRYKAAHVLLVSWHEDDLGVKVEIEGLKHVFRDFYNFQVQSFEIPTLKPDKALKRRILDFLEFDGEECLLILYYAGHTRRGRQPNSSPIWFANRNNSAVSVPSSGVQSMLEEADSDVLLLLDSCHSATITTNDSMQTDSGVTEVIAACAFESVAAGVSEHSFTKTLTDILAIASKGTPFSVSELHARIFARLMCWTPNPRRTQNGIYLEHYDGSQIALEPSPRRTPFHNIVRESNPRRSIVISPLSQPATLPTPSPSSNAQNSSDASSNSAQVASSSSRAPGKRKRGDENVACPQILLAIRLEKVDDDPKKWLDWIKSMPNEGREVHIEGKYDSCSTLVLARIPMALWNLLPENPAYSFVGFVTSENKVGDIIEKEHLSTASVLNRSGNAHTFSGSSNDTLRADPDSSEHLMAYPSPRLSGQEPLLASAGAILPKSWSSGEASLPFSPLPEPPPPAPRKRGRPSKADVERRQQEAIARGERFGDVSSKPLVPQLPPAPQPAPQPAPASSVVADVAASKEKGKGTEPSTEKEHSTIKQTPATIQTQRPSLDSLSAEPIRVFSPVEVFHEERNVPTSSVDNQTTDVPMAEDVQNLVNEMIELVPPPPPLNRNVSEPTNRNLRIHLRSGTFLSPRTNIRDDTAEDTLSVTSTRGSPVVLTPSPPHSTWRTQLESESESMIRYQASESEQASDPWNPNSPYLDLRALHEAHVSGYLNPDREYPNKVMDELETLTKDDEEYEGIRNQKKRKGRRRADRSENSQGLDRYKKERDDHTEGSGGMSAN